MRAALLLPALLAGCGGNSFQSALEAAGPGAAAILRLWHWLLAVGVAVLLVVCVLLVMALIRRRAGSDRPPWGETRFIVGLGLAGPAVILTGLLLATLVSGRELRQPPDAAGVTIQIVAHQYWWEVRYPGKGVVTANEVAVPAGVPVHLDLRAADVIHSLWVPNLQGKMDMLPDHPNRFWLQADRPGHFRGVCAEFCGIQHAWMAFDLEAMPPAAFARWLDARARPAPAPADEGLARGREVFFRAKCHSCHAIAGTEAHGVVGPDLTHVGARPSLGAGRIPYSPQALADWIADPQRLKPGNHMPQAHLSPADLAALSAWLDSLK